MRENVHQQNISMFDQMVKNISYSHYCVHLSLLPCEKQSSKIKCVRFRTVARARTLCPVSTNALAREGSPGATVSITPPCTATQVRLCKNHSPNLSNQQHTSLLLIVSTEACGPDATCINRPSGLGYDCRCHLGKSGNKCMDGKTQYPIIFEVFFSHVF